MSADLCFESLTNEHPDLDLVTSWVHEEWGKDEPQDFADSKRDLLDQPGCPPTKLAMRNGSAVGLVSFRRYPVPELEITGLWVNMLYVDQDHRHQGIGSELIQLAEKQSTEFDLQLFVYTPFPALYEKSGWQPFRPANEVGSSVLTKK